MKSGRRSAVPAIILTLLGFLVPVLVGVAVHGSPQMAEADGADWLAGLPPDEQAAKLEAIAGSVAVEVPLPEDADPRQLPPVEQVTGISGAADVVAAVEAAAPPLLVAEILTVQIPDNSSASIDAAQLALPDRVRAVYATSQVSYSIELLSGLLEAYRADPEMQYASDARFSLDAVLGVDVTSPTTATISLQGAVSTPALVTARSYPTVTTPDGWGVYPPHIYNMSLVLEANGWRILNRTTTYLDGAAVGT